MDNTSNTPQRKEIVQALWKLQKIILDTLDFNQVVQRTVDGLLSELGYLQLGYRIIVLTLINEEKGVLQRISLSSTPEAARAQEASAIPFHDIEVPLNAQNNTLIRALTEKRPFVTQYWPDLFRPVLTDEQALKNQQAAGIKTSMVYPVVVRDKAIGILIFSMVKDISQVQEEEKELILGFTDIVGLAVQNSRLYSSLANTTRELRVANEKLEQLDKLKDEFVSLASHELRTPMTVIKSYIWMLLEGKAGELSEKQRSYLDRTYTSTDRLINMVNDMLNISRIESGRLTVEPKPLSMPSLVAEVIAEMQTRAQEQQLLLQFVPPQTELPMVYADLDRIKQVLINLIGNSLKFTPQGGSISLMCEQKDGYIVTHVKDTGRGIKAEDMNKLFRKFNMLGSSYLTKQSGQGTGLGLYLSKALVELHKGRIWVASEGEGKGTTFSFSLPAVSSRNEVKKQE